MTTTFRVGTGNAQNFAKSVIGKYRCAVPKAAVRTVNRAARQSQSAIKAEMISSLDRPQQQTIDAVRIIQAESSSTIDKIEAAVHLTPWASDVLRDDIFGGTIFSVNDEPDIFIPILANLGLSEVQSAIGDIVNQYGNIIGLRGGAVFDRILRHPQVFEIDTRAHEWLEKGIWFRMATDAVLPLFLSESSAQREAIFDFFGAGVRIYTKQVSEVWPVELQKAIEECS